MKKLLAFISILFAAGTLHAGPKLTSVMLSTQPLGGNATFYFQRSTHTIDFVIKGSTVASFSSTGTAILAHTSGVEPMAGFVGETISTTTANKSFPTSTQYGDLVSTSIPAGDWDLTFCYAATANGATVPSISVGISTVTGNSTATLIQGDNFLENMPGPVDSVSQASGCLNWRYLSSVALTFYGKYSATYSVATPVLRGTLRARRRR